MLDDQSIIEERERRKLWLVEKKFNHSLNFIQHRALKNL